MSGRSLSPVTMHGDRFTNNNNNNTNFYTGLSTLTFLLLSMCVLKMLNICSQSFSPLHYNDMNKMVPYLFSYEPFPF